MVKLQFGLKELKGVDDAIDALAIAVTVIGAQSLCLFLMLLVRAAYVRSMGARAKRGAGGLVSGREAERQSRASSHSRALSSLRSMPGRGGQLIDTRRRCS